MGYMMLVQNDFCTTLSEKCTLLMCLSLPRSHISKQIKPRRISFPASSSARVLDILKSSKELYLWTLAFQSTPFEASLAASYREFSEATRSKSSYFPIVSCLFFSLAAFRLWYRCSRLSSLVTIQLIPLLLPSTAVMRLISRIVQRV